MKVQYISHMGNDLSVVNSARVSFSKESKYKCYMTDDIDEAYSFEKDNLGSYMDHDYIYSDSWMGGYPVFYLEEQDVKLIKYLAKHDHWTPFAHTAITLRMQAPVPIRTQCFKHKQGFVENEESRRYIDTRPELYIPDEFRERADKAKQGSGSAHRDSPQWKVDYIENCLAMIYLYDKMIEEGICPEQARFVLPQGVETQWIWTGNLYSYANFYLKRTDPHAQKEIRDLAEMVGDIIEPLFPVSWKALTQGE